MVCRFAGDGVTAGLLGDKLESGFLEETEYQVEAHLNEHLESLPAQDAKSRAIVSQMREDGAACRRQRMSWGRREVALLPVNTDACDVVGDEEE